MKVRVTFMSEKRNIERSIQEYVPGKRVTLAHLIPHANEEVLKN